MLEKLSQFIKDNKQLVFILSLSLFVTLVYAFVFRIHPVVDAKAYDQIAQNIIAGNGFVEDANLSVKDDKAIIRVGPLYQYFLAGIYGVFGHHYEFVWVIQAILHTASAYFVYLSALLLFSARAQKEKIALLATAIFAFFPDLIEISAMLMTETLYIFLWTALIWYFLDFVKKEKIKSKKSWYQVLFLGLLGGFATMARPPVLFVLPVIFFYFWSKRRLALLALLGVSVGAVFVPWTVRNYNAYDKIMPFGGAGAYNFWIGNHVGASGEQDKPDEVEAFIEENGAYLVSDKSLDEFKKFVIAHPGDFMRLTLLRTNRYFSVARPMGFWFYDSGLSQFIFILSSALASTILFIFSLVGAIYIWKEKTELNKYFLSLIFLTPLILLVTVVETRYRFQIYPLLAILAGMGIFSVFSGRNWWKNKALILSVILVALNAIIDLSMSLDKLMSKLGLFI